MLLTPDNAIDPELWEWCPPGVSLHITRLMAPGLERMQPTDFNAVVRRDDVVQEATRALVLIEPEVIGFTCTSGSFLEGFAAEAEIRESMLKAGARRAVTTSGAVVEALRAIGARKVAVGTPYEDWLGERLGVFLTEAGFEIPSLVSHRPSKLDETSDEHVIELAEAAFRPGIDCLFISCAALRTRHLLGPLSERLGVPVLSSTQAMMWATLREAGIEVGGGEHALRGLTLAAAR
jgi:maleate isomerase